jgi:phosphate-selective porin OprO/OprP
VVLKGKGTSFDWVVGYDGKANKWLDVDAKWKLGNNYLMFGQFKQPNSQEELSSTKNNDFISKAMVTNLFGLSRRLGVAYGSDKANWGYSVNAFGRELTRNLTEGAGYGGRFYYAPWNEAGQVLHFGVSAVDYDTHFDTARLRVRPDADLSVARLVDTANLTDADRQRTFGLEGMWVGGPFKVQSEYMTSTVERLSHDNFTGDSWYVSGVWNITGETWGYKAGVPTTPLPNEPGTGMWQVGVRYDKTNLNDNLVKGGEEGNWTLGVNWYLRSNFKLMFNYVKVDSTKFSSSLHHDVDDSPNILETRVQFYW